MAEATSRIHADHRHVMLIRWAVSVYWFSRASLASSCASPCGETDSSMGVSAYYRATSTVSLHVCPCISKCQQVLGFTMHAAFLSGSSV